MIHGMGRLARIVAVALGLVVLTAAPAAADAAGPSDFRSEVTTIKPPLGGLEAEILGGDSFLELRVEPEHTVIVTGYEGEPYLRFQPDGTVERNRLSTATYLNDDRKGTGVEIPAEATAAEPDTPPEWEAIATGGTYAWHDHRVHWMDEASPNVARGERVGGEYDPWRVPIVVDGAQSEIQGTLVYASSVSPVPYFGFAVIVAGLLAWYGRSWGLRVGAGLLAAVAAVAVVVGWGDYRATPDSGGNPLLWALAAIALAAALGAVALARRSAGVVLALASVASLSAWGLFRLQALFKPILPTELPYALDRTTIAAALGVSVAVAFLAVTSGVIQLPDLDDDIDAAGP
jgi:hypothetical protein